MRQKQKRKEKQKKQKVLVVEDNLDSFPSSVGEKVRALFNEAKQMHYQILLLPTERDLDSTRESAILGATAAWSLVKAFQDNLDTSFVQYFLQEMVDLYTEGVNNGLIQEKNGMPHMFKHINGILKTILDYTTKFEGNVVTNLEYLLESHTRHCQNPKCNAEQYLKVALEKVKNLELKEPIDVNSNMHSAHTN
jgi:hypothetical protein